MSDDGSSISSEDTGPVDVVDLEAVGRALKPEVRPTTFLGSPALDASLGAQVRLASETFQHTGSFKYRAALAVALHSQAGHLLAASSGNFGAALAMAARRVGKRCTVVMPTQSARVKIDSVRSHGATVELVDTSRTSRLARVEELRATIDDVQVISAYDDPYVIAGNASLGAEILQADGLDCIVVPVGGGGLSSGLVRARDRHGGMCQIYGAEPALANDAARSLAAGVLCRDEKESTTICDGARTLALGQLNFAILRRGLAAIVEVPEALVARAVRLLYGAVNLKVEPTGALAVAALLAEPARFAGKRVTCVVSGGNVDAALYARLLTDEAGALEWGFPAAGG